jgi:Putative Zn-dependent protease, contains TPR repeats
MRLLFCLMLLCVANVGLSAQEDEISELYRQLFHGRAAEVLQICEAKIKTFAADSTAVDSLPAGLSPEAKEWMLLAGYTYKQMASYGKAISLYQKMWMADSTDYSILLPLAECFMAQGEYIKAQEPLERLYVQDTTQAAVAYTLSMAGLRSAQAGQAGKTVDRSLQLAQYLYKQQPRHYPYLKILGDCHYMRDELSEAYDYYNRAYDVDGGRNTALLHTMASILLNIKRHLDLKLLVQRALKRDTADFFIMRKLGSSYYLQDSLKQSIHWLERAHHAGDTSFALHQLMGIVYYFDNQPQKALPHLAKAFKEDIHGAETLYYYGAVLGETGNEGMGLGVLGMAQDELLALIEPLHMVYAQQGKIYYKTEHYAEAYVAYNNALRENPNQHAYLFEAARCLQGMNRLQEAIQTFERYIAATEKQGKLPPAEWQRVQSAIWHISQITETLFFQDK